MIVHDASVPPDRATLEGLVTDADALLTDATADQETVAHVGDHRRHRRAAMAAASAPAG